MMTRVAISPRDWVPAFRLGALGGAVRSLSCAMALILPRLVPQAECRPGSGVKPADPCKPAQHHARAWSVQPSFAVAERQATYSSKDIRGPQTGHHFLHIDDFSRDELMAMLKTSAEVKRRLQDRDESYKPFAGRTMSMIFTKPSMRTRLSFETVSQILADPVVIEDKYGYEIAPHLHCCSLQASYMH